MGAEAAAMAIANAIKASGVVVRVSAEDFATILRRVEKPLVIYNRGDRASEWAIWVSGNWRITFRFAKGEVHDINLEDYH